MLKKDKPDIIITDIRMPIMNGLDLLKYIYENKLNIKCVLLSGDYSLIKIEKTIIDFSDIIHKKQDSLAILEVDYQLVKN